MEKIVTLLLCMVLFNTYLALAQWQKPQFTRLSTNEGLSQSHVNAIFKDSKGFMWFGTDEGLNKYDGYKFSIYKHYQETSTSLINNFVNDIVEDKSGVLWLATRNGLDKFDREKDTFIHYHRGLSIQDIYLDSEQRMWLGTTTSGLYCLDKTGAVLLIMKHDSTNKNSLSDNAVYQITEDDQGNFWIATHNGLTKITLKAKHIERYQHDARNSESIRSNSVRTVFTDSEHTVWAGMTGGGVARYNAQRNSFVSFLHDAKNPASLGYNDVLSLMDGPDKSIWIGTENGGISVYNTKTGTFSTFGNDIYDDKSLSNNSVYCLYKDNTGNIWVGTYSGGINFMPASGTNFKSYRNIPGRNSLSNNSVLSVKGDANGIVWLGTDGGGLNRFDSKTEQFSVYKHQLRNDKSPSSDYIISVVTLAKNTLALGYHRNGFDLFDTQKNRFLHYQPIIGNQNELSALSVNSLFTDKQNNLWLGTWMHGLFCYNPVSKRVVQFTHSLTDANSISNNSINSICEDRNGIIWIGTEDGLDSFDMKKNLFSHYKHDSKDDRSISSNTIQCLLVNDDTSIWIGTAGGLCLFNQLTKKFTVVSERNGLANNVINGLAKDARGNLWLSTNRGISKYYPASGSIKNYDASDGLQGSEFKVGSVYQTPEGRLYFGGTNGFTSFHPDSIQDNTFVPPVYLTDFQIFNKSVLVGAPESPLKEHINSTKAITLTHEQGVFSFEFAALNYTLPLKNQYAYKLEGFDKDWNYVGTKRTATYTNLDPDDYVFRVQGSNNDGIWNVRGVAIAIQVLPPFWETWWFRALAVLLLAGSTYLFYQGRINAVQAQKWALEQIVDERTERLHQEQVLNKMKSQFVSTASHEFRTPLATIQSSIDLVDMYLDFPLDNGKPLIHKHLRIVEKEIGKFGELLDDVLTIEKMNAGKVLFAPKSVDFLAIYDELVATHFQTRKDQRWVELTTCGQPRSVLLDEKLINHALVNLISNAFKFSAANPRLDVNFEDQALSISVSDQGIGIPAKDMPHLFETFFRAENVSTIQGTGLGLFITKQAVELHGGSIQVHSREDVGTTFTITLPT